MAYFGYAFESWSFPLIIEKGFYCYWYCFFQIAFGLRSCLPLIIFNFFSLYFFSGPLLAVCQFVIAF